MEDMPTYYTLEDARKIINEENRAKRQIIRERRRIMRIMAEAQRKEKIQMRLIGIGCLIFAALVPIFLDGDASVDLLIIPAALWFLFGKAS